MKIRRLIAGLLLAAGAVACAHSPQSLSEHHEASIAAHPSALEAAPRVDFTTQVRPILENRCQPCHFPGGQLYQLLPFDRAETIVHLREKLFTRIKDEHEQRLIREFLSQEAPDRGAVHAGS
ncbi:MAG TPA: hypothetical protein VKK31_01985 [Thermoanaerobaculia bacterium]|nr:hypothetical protein [Thermoanaerobaculia bacterium]